MKKLLYTLMTLLLLVGAFTQKSYSQDTTRILLEVWTGTWCQWCPCGHTIVNTIMTNKPNTLVFEYHGGSTTDPWYNFNGNTILSLLGDSYGYPGGVIGRRTAAVGRTSWAGQVYSQEVNFPTAMKLWYSKTYNASTRQLSVTAYATAIRNIDTAININFVLYENNLIYPQSGNASCTGGTSYVHKYVVRDMVNGATGESLSTGTWTAGTVKTKTWTYTLPAAWVANNVGFGVFTYKNIGTFGFDNYAMQTSKGTAIDPVSGVGNQRENIGSYTLSQNYPNPFNPTTNIRFSIPKNAETSLKIYDVLGNEVNTYFNEFLNAGTYSVEFDGGNLASGMYYYKLTSGSFSETKRMMLVK